MTDPILKRIQWLCPDILELKFGCLVSCYMPPYEESYEEARCPARREIGIVTNSPYLQVNEVFGDVVVDDLKNEIVSEEDGYEFEILGTDPTLAVVLRAIRANNPANKTLILVEADGQFIQKSLIGNEVHTQGKEWWNLEHDSFAWHVENQPETIKFIGELLGV